MEYSVSQHVSVSQLSLKCISVSVDHSCHINQTPLGLGGDFKIAIAVTVHVAQFKKHSEAQEQTILVVCLPFWFYL